MTMNDTPLSEQSNDSNTSFKEELEKIGKEEEINQFNKCLNPIPSKKDLPD